MISRPNSLTRCIAVAPFLALLLCFLANCDDNGTKPSADRYRFEVFTQTVEDEGGVRTTTIEFPRRDGDARPMPYDLYYDDSLIEEQKNPNGFGNYSVLMPDWWPLEDNPLPVTMEFEDGKRWDTFVPVFEPMHVDLELIPGDTLEIGDFLTVRLVDQWFNNAWLEVEGTSLREDFWPDSTATLDFHGRQGVFRVALCRSDYTAAVVSDPDNDREIAETWHYSQTKYFWIRRMVE